jgi:acetyl-CoA acyltransferase 1
LQQFDSFCHGSFCMLLLSTCRHNLAGAAAVILVLHRQVQDEFAAASHRKAAAAQTAGKFSAEIVPVHTKVKDPKTGSEQKVGCRRHC